MKKQVNIPVSMSPSDMAKLKKVKKAAHPERIKLPPGVASGDAPETGAKLREQAEASAVEFTATCPKCGAPSRADGTCSLAEVPAEVASDHPDYGKKTECQRLAEMVPTA